MATDFIYLGHHRKDIYSLLAMEEAMQGMAAKEGLACIMTAQVSRPAITIAERESAADIRTDRCAADGIDFTRRLGGGSVIWLDENMLIYFITGPRPEARRRNLAEEFSFHRKLGERIAAALKDLGAPTVYTGEKFSVCLGKGPQYVVSGNAVILRKGYFSYHGVLVLRKLNVKAIKNYVVLRKTDRVDEEVLLSRLPSLSEAVGRDLEAKEAAAQLTRKLTEGRFRDAVSEERERIENDCRLLKSRYESRSWIFDNQPIRDKNVGFCLIALAETWQEKNFYKA